MRVPLGWLREWISVEPATTILAERLTLAGLAVDSIERIGPELAGVRVGLVRERSPHPGADRLSVCRVELGPEVEDGAPLEIVCGAPNVAAGQKVAVALPGTRLPDGSVLKRSKIRGVFSNGMICSARELGLGGEHEGILVLDPAAPIGAPLSSVVAVGDTVLELELTPNRGDCASILGVAREVRALFGGELRLPPCEPKEDGPPASAQVRVEVRDAAGCPQYIARVVRGVRVGPSPEWLRRRLESIGARSISNVVDVTNLVLHELGQPLHAFDLSTLRGGTVKVRSAVAGESLVTLDGEARALSPEDLVIADAERPIALAGIMGGSETEVTSKTADLLIESAQFAPSRIRRSARRAGIRSEASYRFERGVDPHGVRRAADRAALLMAEVAGGTVSSGALEVRSLEALAPRGEIVLDPARVGRLLGTKLAAESVRALLERLEIRVTPREGRLVCVPPSYRPDLALPEDLVEEVARIHGYERIPATLPEAPVRPVLPSRVRVLRERVADALVGAGLVETMTLAFMNPGDLDRLELSLDDPRRRTVRVLNPVSEEDSRLRSTLLPSLLRATRQNLARRVERVHLFEISRVFLAVASGESTLPELPDEPLRLLAVLTRGERTNPWEPHEPIPLFFEAKGLAERLLRGLGYTAWFRAGTTEPYLHPGAGSDIGVGETVVGCVGELHPEVAAAFDIGAACAVCELDLRALAELVPEPTRYQEVSNQPPVRRDIAVLIDRDRPAGDILEAIRKTAGPNLVSADIFDRYAGGGIPDGKVSLAFRLIFQRPDRALTDDEIVRLTDRVVQMLAQRFGGELR